jgi:hypothetical protein
MAVVRDVLVLAAVVGTIVFSFVVVPELFRRRGYDPRSAKVRAAVWITFLSIIGVPGLASGFLFSVSNPADWGLLVVALLVAILYDYYRLHPGAVPRYVRRKAPRQPPTGQ